MFGKLKGTLFDRAANTAEDRMESIYLRNYQCRFKDRSSMKNCIDFYHINMKFIRDIKDCEDGTVIVTFTQSYWSTTIFTVRRRISELIKDKLPDNVPVDNAFINEEKKQLFYYTTIYATTTNALITKLHAEKVLKENVISIVPENNGFVAVIYKEVDIRDELRIERSLIMDEMESMGIIFD